LSFSLSSVTQTGAAVLRVTFTDAMPLSASPQGLNDALNKFNWTLQGPVSVSVGLVRTVSGDPFSFDLVCVSALISGTWTLKAGDIRTPFGVIIDVNSLQFVSNGAQQYFSVPLSAMTSETVVRQALNAALDGPGWKALVAALGYSDQKNTELAVAAAAQKNLATATGTYLENITTSYGVDRKADVGISDDTLRILTLGLNANKVNTLGLEAVLQAYYGDNATIAHATAGMAQPYAIVDGDSLIFEVDNVNVLVAFAASDFQDPDNASAQEVATVINRELRLLGMAALATEFVDPNTGLIHLRIYSGQNGIKGYLRFHGGSIDAALQFPTILDVGDMTIDTQWYFETSANNPGVIPFGTIQMIYDGGTQPNMIGVFVGDYVNIYADQGDTTQGMQGTWQITDILVNVDQSQYVVSFAAPLNANPNGGDFTPQNLRDLFFSRPSVIRLQANNVAFVSQAAPGASEIVLAATTVAVGRTLKTAWYLNGSAPIQLLTSDSDVYPTNYRGGFVHGADAGLVTIKTASPHGLAVNRFFFLDNLVLAESDAIEDDVTLLALATPQLKGGWNPTTGGYLGWDANSHTFKFLNSAGSSITDLGAAGLGASNGPTLVSLNNGQVLIVSDSTALIFDPNTVTFTATAAPPNVKVSGSGVLSGTLLANGSAMVIGTDGTSLWSDIYSPTLGSWGTSHQFAVANPSSWFSSSAIGESRTWTSIAWSPLLGIFAAVASDAGATGQVGTSSDGRTWKQRNAPVSHSWVAIIWASGPAIFVAVATDGAIMTSADGTNWNIRTAPSARQWTALSYSPDKNVIVAVAQDGTAAQQVAYSSDGITWLAATSPSVRQWASIDWSPKLRMFVAVAKDGTTANQFMYSRNGIAWYSTAIPSTAVWSVIKWSPDANVFAAMSNDNSGAVFTSSNGLTWTLATGRLVGFSWTALEWSSDYGVFAALGNFFGAGNGATSPDGITWTTMTPPTAGSPTGLAYSSKLGFFVATAYVNAFAVSLNGGNSTEVNLPGALTTPDGYVYYIMTNPTKGFVYSPSEDLWRGFTLPSVSGTFYSMDYIDDGTPRGSIWLSTTDTSKYLYRIDLSSITATQYAFNQGGFTPTTYYVAPTPSKEIAMIPKGNTNAPVTIINPRAPSTQSSRIIMPGGNIGGTGDNDSMPLLLTDGRIVYTDFSNSRWLSLNIYSQFKQQSGGGLANVLLQVTGVSAPNVLSFRTPFSPYRTRIKAGTLTPVLPATQALASGYILDSTEGVALADVQTTTTTIVAGGVGPRILNVASTAGIPNEPGYITLAFGQDNQSLPIRYTGVASSTQLLLDPSALLAQRYPSGTTVDLLTARGPFAPADSTPFGVTWLTSSVVGRLAAETDLAFAEGAGLDVTTTVVYPGDRGLGNEGQPTHGVQKLTDAVYVWGSDDIDAELATDRETT
jgi:hypothetical protein